METRLASAADAPVMTSIHAESFGDACWSRPQIAESLALETSYALIAYENDAAQGFIMCQMSGNEAEILTFCVAQTKRCKGIGRCLLETAIAYARQKNVKHMFLEVAIDNIAALALYEKTGFRSTGKRKNYYKRGAEMIDAVMLELALR